MNSAAFLVSKLCFDYLKPDRTQTMYYPRAPLPTVLIHWFFVFSLGVSLATGFRIGADALDAQVLHRLAPWLPQGDVFFWHVLSGALLIALLLAYLFYQGLSGLGGRLLPGALARRLITEPGGTPWWLIDQLLYWALLVLLLISFTTGIVQYAGLSFLPRPTIEALHLLAAWGLVVYLILHVLLRIAAGGLSRLLGIVLARRAYLGVGAAATFIGVLAIAMLVGADRLIHDTLAIERVDAAPVLDGNPTEPQWLRARPTRLHLTNGANLPGGETEVELRAVHDGDRLYLLCEWTDPTRSQKHLPLIKERDGWRILQTAFRRADENDYYEDKLALMLAPADPLAALTSVHLGSRPLADEPGPPGGRGLHYTHRGIVDVWHWKSVRNDYQRQADDNFFSPPLAAPPERPREPPTNGAWLPRYTAGYRKDPPGTYSGYRMNWENFDEGLVLPLRLPDDRRDLLEPDAVDFSPEVGDSGRWWIEFNDTHPYARGPDDLPIGTLLQSVLPTGRLTGDRGDIAARGTWSNGRWHLELSRKLDTGSERDVAIRDGVLIWVAVFDHTQTRHAYHLRPVRIELH